MDRSVETLRSKDRFVDTTLETEVAEDRTAEFDVPNEVPAEVMPEVETTLLTTTSELRNEDTCVEATVAMLVTEETPLDRLVSADLLLEIRVWRAEIWLAAVEAPVEALVWAETAVDTPVFSSVT